MDRERFAVPSLFSIIADLTAVCKIAVKTKKNGFRGKSAQEKELTNDN
jgi:hypothetical protein